MNPLNHNLCCKIPDDVDESNTLVHFPASVPLRKATEVKVLIVTKLHFLLKKKKGSVAKASLNYLIFS